MNRTVLKGVSVIVMLVLAFTFIPLNGIKRVEAADTTWTVIDYSNKTDADLSVEDVALMHEDNWLNQKIATDRSKTVTTLTLADFLSFTSITKKSSSLTEIPESIKFMTNLTTLDLSDNKLTSLPSCIGNLTKLRYLHLYCNNLTSIPDSIGNLTQMYGLYLNANKLTSLPDSICNLKGYWGKGLYELNVQGNYILKFPSTLTYVYSLAMEDNMLTSYPAISTTYNGSALNFYNHYQLSLSNTEDLTLNRNDVLDKASIVSTFIESYKTIPQSVVDQLLVVAEDPTIIDSTGKALKAGTTNIRLQLPNNPVGNAGGITQQSVQVTVIVLSQGDDIGVTFSQADTVQLSLSSDSVSFGGVTGVASTAVTGASIEVSSSIKSSLPYSLIITATGNITNTSSPDASQVPITKLSIGVDNGAKSKFEGVNIPKILISSISDTSTLTDVTRGHTLQLELDETVGYKSGDYSVPLVVTVSQM